LVEGFGFSCWLLHVLQMFWISENQCLVNCQLPAARKDLIRQAMMYSRQKNPHGLFFYELEYFVRHLGMGFWSIL
jgi:hypothetical protein